MHSQLKSYSIHIYANGPHIYPNLSQPQPVLSNNSLPTPTKSSDEDAETTVNEHCDNLINTEALSNNCSHDNLHKHLTNDSYAGETKIPNKFIIEDNIEKKKSTSFFFIECCNIFKQTSKKFKIVFLMIMISLISYLSMLSFGSIYINYCPLEPNIPIWLIVEGAFGVVFVLQICDAIRNGTSVSRFFILALHMIFHMIWLIAGVIIIYGVLKYEHKIDSSKCNFLTAYITPLYIMLGSIIWVGVFYFYCINSKDDLCLAVVTLLLATSILTVLIFMIFIGILFYDDCPLEPRIPVWFIIGGLIGIILLFQVLELEFHPESFYRKLFVITHILFHICWIIRGVFLVYEMSDISYGGYCRPSLYLSTYPFLVYITLLVILCCYALRFRYKDVHEKVFILLLANMIRSKKRNLSNNQEISSEMTNKYDPNNVSINFNYFSQEYLNVK